MIAPTATPIIISIDILLLIITLKLIITLLLILFFNILDIDFKVFLLYDVM